MKMEEVSDPLEHVRKLMPTEPQEEVSVIGIGWLFPIYLLIERLETKPDQRPNEVRASTWENGHACALVIMSTSMLESAMNRTRYIRNEGTDDHTAEYFGEVTGDRDLTGKLDEVFAVRDVIVHNHIWESWTFTDTDFQTRFAKPPVLREGYGGKRMRRVLNAKTRCTQRLGLNLFPSRIWRGDAYIILAVVNDAIARLDAIDKRYFFGGMKLPLPFEGKPTALDDVLRELVRRLGAR